MSWPGTLLQPYYPMGEITPTSAFRVRFQLRGPGSNRAMLLGHGGKTIPTEQKGFQHRVSPFYIGLTCDLRWVNFLCLRVTLL